MEVVNKLIDTDGALVNQFDSNAKSDMGTSGTAGDSSSKLRKRPSEVLAIEACRPSTFNTDEFNTVLDGPYTFHEGATHTVHKFSQFKRAFHTPEDPKRPRGNSDQSSSRLYNNNRRDDRRNHGEDNHRDERHRDEPQLEDRRNERAPPATGNPNGPFQQVLTVNSCIKIRLDLQVDKSPVVVKGPFFPRVVNPRHRIRGKMCNARI
jgi:hypothetical protein